MSSSNPNQSVSIKHERSIPSSSISSSLPHNSRAAMLMPSELLDLEGPRRRSSSRSIKRKKFDDELVDSMSTSYPKHQKIIKNETDDKPFEELKVESEEIIVPVVESNKKLPKQSTSAPINTVHKKKGRKSWNKSIINAKHWKPSDDLALIINVEQTNDLKKVYDGVKFSNKFSYHDIETRWHSLLYVENDKKLALAAIRGLHPDIVNLIQSKALFSEAEENLLKKIESGKTPTIESLQELINTNAEVFLPSRTPKTLLKHWRLLRHYQMLDDQSLQPVPRHESVVSFSEIEEIVREEIKEELKNPELLTANTSDLEMKNQDIISHVRKSMLEIRMLENELPKYQALLDSITRVLPSDFDQHTNAVLRGRIVRYLMRSTQITIGRITKDFEVDVDLSLEGPSTKISRLQAIINLQPTGEFMIFNTGKHPIYIDSKPLLSDCSLQIHHNSLLEFSSLKFIFLINQDLISKMRNDIFQTYK